MCGIFSKTILALATVFISSTPVAWNLPSKNVSSGWNDKGIKAEKPVKPLLKDFSCKPLKASKCWNLSSSFSK